jgi:signal transduction histidine kinase/DNA-binding LacI/PurR family transcriptional regulator/AraC-like DNA-binding protein
MRIGFLAGWQVYDGATLERYLHDVMRGAVQAAHDQGCELLLACGVGPPTRPYVFRPAWPTRAPDATYVPVSARNCDGLLIAPPVHFAAGIAQIDDLLAANFPIVYAGASASGPTVALDNAAGIAASVAHLKAHGHQRIAFISGHDEPAGDSYERLQAFGAAMQAAGLPVDPQLIVRGYHSVEAGDAALQHLLATGATFSALVASNDHSAMGALLALRRAGLRVPEDVAVIGFDDLLDARVQTPPLTTVHHSAFDLGYQSLLALGDLIAGRWDGHQRRNIPARLIVRQSCGCRPGIVLGAASAVIPAEQALELNQVSATLLDAVCAETGQQHLVELATYTQKLVQAFDSAIQQDNEQPFRTSLVEALRATERLGEAAYNWHAALLALQQALPALMITTPMLQLRAERLISWAHLTISERSRRQGTRAVLRQIELADRVGTMTSQLLANLDEQQIAQTLEQHLAQLDIAHMLVAHYEAEGADPYAWCRVVLSVGLPMPTTSRCAASEFPPAAYYATVQPVRLALLPLVIDDLTVGVVAFAASNLEPCAAIVRNLASALRTSTLYREAAEGRRLAEAANQLKTQFLSTVSHELRTPLSVVVGLSEMALRDLPADTADSALRSDLERIYTSAQHLGQLIGDVLDLTSSDAGQLRLLRELLDLAEVIRTIAPVGEHMAQAKGLIWQAAITDTTLQVLGDRTRLRQIVLNLISNAVKFTERGTISLTVGQERNTAVIEVRDTGIGVAPAEQAQIFDVFRRTQMSITQGYSGLGLGLAICRQLAELHGGQISLHSTGIAGEGTSVRVVLPLVEATPLATPLPHDLLIIGAQGALLAEPLRAQGYTIRLLNTVSDLEPTLLTPLPGAILLDSSAAMTARPLLNQLIQHDARIAQIPLLLWEGDPAAQTPGALLELNVLRKPLERDQLGLALLRTGLDQAAGPTVLIVDDTAHMRDLHRRIVGEALPNAQIAEAVHGRAALDYLAEHTPDLILLDLMMPELDGFGVLEALHAEPRTRAIPVLVLSARPLDDADLARLQRGVAGILAKGLFSIEETISHITAALQRQRRLSSQTRRLVHRALAFMHEHYAEALSRDLIAAHVGVNENYLSECFQAEMGLAPMTYLTRYRISRARTLLEQSDAAITAIAIAVGFNDSAYFSRVFQREVGMSPRAYRRSLPST